MVKIKTLLHPTDFSDNSDQALKYACSLATQYGAELHLINVIQDVGLAVLPIPVFIPPDYLQQLQKYAREELASLPGKIVNHKGPVIRNVEGQPFVEIIRYAKQNDIDLIVMGTHGYSGLNHMIMGSVAENVVRKSPCPVLTIHPENYEFVMP